MASAASVATPGEKRPDGSSTSDLGDVFMAIQRIFLLSLIVVFSGSWLQSQTQRSTADLVGRVTDATGQVLPGVEVQVRNVETGLTREGVTSDDGFYRISLLPPGDYIVRFELPGFAVQTVRGVQLTVGQSGDLSVRMEVAPIDTEVEVVSDAAIVERVKSAQTSFVGQAEINSLPINGRNYLDFALLTPGVADRNTLNAFGVVQTPTSGLSFAGQDQRNTYVAIDGADSIDVVSNSVRSTLSQEAIQEFQVIRSSYNAEFGRSRGGVVNIVSKSGTNEFHGNAFFFFRNNALDARNFFAFGPDRTPIDPDFRRYQWGGTLGGPIVPNKTFFFGTYERLDRKEANFVTFLDDREIFQATPSQQELFGFLSSTGIPTLQLMSAAFTHPQFGVLNTLETNFPATLNLFESESGSFPFEAEQNLFSVKLDHIFSQNNNLFVRFDYSDSFNDGVEFGALQGVSNGVSFDSRDFTAVLGNSHIFSPTRLNDFRFQYARREFAVPTNDPIGPEIFLDGVALFGREFNNPTAYDTNFFQFVNNFTFFSGNHSFKTGFDLAVNDLSGFAEVFMGGQFRFGEAIPLAAILDNLLGAGTAAGLIAQLSTPEALGGLGRPALAANVLRPISTVQAFNFGLPITYLQSFGDPSTDVTYTQLAAYFQDSWRARPDLTLHLGLRYDIDWRPTTVNVVTTAPPFELSEFAVKDRNNFAPRLGFAWDVGGANRTVVRGGYGIYYGNFFQAVGFVGKVLSGQLSQVFLPITGLPGFDVTSADLFGFFRQTGQVGEPMLAAFGISPGTTPSGILPMSPDAVNPYSQHASFGIEHALAADWAISLDYMLNRGVKLLRSRDINVREIGPNQFALPGLDPRFIQIGMIETSGSSIYHGFTASLRKRFSDGYSVNAAYTLGKSIDDTTDFATQTQAADQTNLAAERGLSTFDQRQRLVVSGVFNSPYHAARGGGALNNILADWLVSPIIVFGSGRPFNLLTGFDANGDGHANTSRPFLANGDMVGRNTGEGPSFAGVDLRVSRKFLLPRERTGFEFIFEAFNLFNRANFSDVNNVTGALILDSGDVKGSKDIPANRFLGFTRALDARQLQFGLKFNF